MSQIHSSGIAYLLMYSRHRVSELHRLQLGLLWQEKIAEQSFENHDCQNQQPPNLKSSETRTMPLVMSLTDLFNCIIRWHSSGSGKFAQLIRRGKWKGGRQWHIISLPGVWGNRISFLFSSKKWCGTQAWITFWLSIFTLWQMGRVMAMWVMVLFLGEEREKYGMGGYFSLLKNGM